MSILFLSTIINNACIVITAVVLLILSSVGISVVKYAGAEFAHSFSKAKARSTDQKRRRDIVKQSVFLLELEHLKTLEICPRPFLRPRSTHEC